MPTEEPIDCGGGGHPEHGLPPAGMSLVFSKSLEKVGDTNRHCDYHESISKLRPQKDRPLCPP